ncbi:MAG: hypothetical protein VYC17_04715 [Nitrospinota bacterium]|nr:hypothetical protein [Nitrospinota bacterium]
MESQMNVRYKQFSDAYLNFTHLFSKSQVEEEEQHVRILEKVVRCIWND